MKEEFKNFNQYVKLFDLKESAIMNKFHHTYRVVNFCEEIAKSLDLNSEDIRISMLCGLLHDIARFKQYTEYGTYEDHKSFDHGDMAYDILRENNFINNFEHNKKVQDIILFAVKNHNKKDIEKSNSRELLFARIVRDADKLDILVEQCNTIVGNNLKLKDNLIDNIYNNKLCSNTTINDDIDRIIRCLSFIFDINFKYSFKFLLDKKIIENKINLLNIYVSDKRINEIENYLINYIKEIVEC